MPLNSDQVFLVANNNIEPLGARPFKAGLFGKNLEDALQTLIERQPNLINGRQIDPGSDDPPRFILLRREMQVGDWSLDHLLVDQHGTLTFVEAKLLQNPESRRAVIGQILDYAAYAAENWSNGRLRQFAAEYWQQHGKDVDDVIRDGFGDVDPEAFWRKVELSLLNQQIRLVVVADELRPEARRVIEFLNNQMRTVEVFGLEIRCFGQDANTVVVPYLVGQTQATAAKSYTKNPARNWSIEELRAAYAEMPGTIGTRLSILLEWAVRHKCIAPGQDTQNPMFSVIGRSGNGL